MRETRKALTASAVAVLLSAIANGLAAQTCVHAYDFYGAPASGLPAIDMPPVRIVHAVIPGTPPTPALLDVADAPS